MILKSSFEVIQVADDYMAVPVGEEAQRFNGVVALSEAAAYLLRQMRTPRSREDLVRLLTEEYDVSRETAEHDVDAVVENLTGLGVIEP